MDDLAAPSTRQNRLRDFGLICLLLGLFLLLVSFAVLFAGPPQPGIAITGGILAAISAAAIATRYRFFAILLICFLAPIGLITALVTWPAASVLFLVAPIAWVVARRRRRVPGPG